MSAGMYHSSRAIWPLRHASDARWKADINAFTLCARQPLLNAPCPDDDDHVSGIKCSRAQLHDVILYFVLTPKLLSLIIRLIQNPYVIPSR